MPNCIVGVVIAGVVDEISLNTQKWGKVFLNQTFIKNEHDRVQRVVQMDFTPPPLLSGRRQYIYLV